MKFSSDNIQQVNAQIFDVNGSQIGLVQEYDSETRIAKMYLRNSTPCTCIIGEDGEIKPLALTVHLPGSYAVFNGQQF